jgi:predicted transcriptional regulator
MQVANVNAKEIELIATIIRADGTKKELGVIDYWHKNPIKRFVWKLKKLLERN